MRSVVDRIMVPAYDDPAVWEGHGSMIEEMAAAPEFANGERPAAIFCCVGGGGLIGGIMDGCGRVGWDDGRSNGHPTSMRRALTIDALLRRNICQ